MARRADTAMSSSSPSAPARGRSNEWYGDQRLALEWRDRARARGARWPTCEGGRRCLETSPGGRDRRRVCRASGGHPTPARGDGGRGRCRRAHGRGDDVAKSVWNDAINHLVAAIAPVISTLGSGRIVIGGGLIGAGETSGNRCDRHHRRQGTVEIVAAELPAGPRRRPRRLSPRKPALRRAWTRVGSGRNDRLGCSPGGGRTGKIAPGSARPVADFRGERDDPGPGCGGGIRGRELFTGLTPSLPPAASSACSRAKWLGQIHPGYGVAGVRAPDQGTITVSRGEPPGLLTQQPDAQQGETIREQLQRRTGASAAASPWSPARTRWPRVRVGRRHEAEHVLETWLALGGGDPPPAGDCRFRSRSRRRPGPAWTIASGGQVASPAACCSR